MPLPNWRSPDFLLVIAVVLCVLSLLAWFALGETPLVWALLICGVPPAIEAEVLRHSAQFAAMVYARDEDEIAIAIYDRTGAMLRCAFMGIVLTAAYLFGRGGYNLVHDFGWAITLTVGPVVAYVVWGGWSYWRRVASAAKSGSWPRRRRR